jgi:putative phosphoribosyl transferase
MTAWAEERAVAISAGGQSLLGSVALPQGRAPVGLALLAADRGCSRQSPDRRAGARALRRAGFATVMVDLLTPDELADEASAAAFRVQPVWLQRRVHEARRWVEARFGDLPLALIGTGGAGAAVLQEAADRPAGIWAVVVDSRFPDLASRLSTLRAPVLFVSESGDPAALARVGSACDHLRCEYGLATVPGPRSGASPIARAEAMGRYAALWLTTHLLTPTPDVRAHENRALPRRAG